MASIVPPVSSVTPHFAGSTVVCEALMSPRTNLPSLHSNYDNKRARL